MLYKYHTSLYKTSTYSLVTGLARALLTHSLQMFKDMGMDHAALGVDTQNLSGALDLYQSVGFRVEKRQTAYRKKL